MFDTFSNEQHRLSGLPKEEIAEKIVRDSQKIKALGPQMLLPILEKVRHFRRCCMDQTIVASRPYP